MLPPPLSLHMCVCGCALGQGISSRSFIQWFQWLKVKENLFPPGLKKAKRIFCLLYVCIAKGGKITTSSSCAWKEHVHKSPSFFPLPPLYQLVKSGATGSSVYRRDAGSWGCTFSSDTLRLIRQNAKLRKPFHWPAGLSPTAPCMKEKKACRFSAFFTASVGKNLITALSQELSQWSPTLGVKPGWKLNKRETTNKATGTGKGATFTASGKEEAAAHEHQTSFHAFSVSL